MNKPVAAAIAAALIVAAAIGVARTGLLDDFGPIGRSCESLTFTNNGTPWRAQKVHRDGLSCAEATSAIKAYAKPTNCQFRPTCRVGGFDCRTLVTEGSTFTERCARGGRSVRWHGSYISR